MKRSESVLVTGIFPKIAGCIAKRLCDEVRPVVALDIEPDLRAAS